jgi:hypothetical protein
MSEGADEAVAGRLLGDRLGGDADDLYAALMAAHEGLCEEESAALNARLVLLLVNAVGDRATVLAAIRRARLGLGAGDPVS